MLPAIPACWTWDLPPLPQPNHLGAVREWQDGRCAVCGDRAELVEDHCHISRETRGYLCIRDNSWEGQRHAPAVFDLYRRSHPTSLIGVRHVYGRKVHPDQERAAIALIYAFEALDGNPRIPWTPLSEALARVGLTREEWENRQQAAEWARRRAAMPV